MKMIRGGTGRRVVAGTAAGAALLLGGVAALQFGGAVAEPGTGRRGLSGAEVVAVLAAADACPALSPSRLAAQLVADRSSLSAEVWNRWAPWPRANRAEPGAYVQALSHHMCQLVGQLRAAGMDDDLWRDALAAHQTGSGAVLEAAGVPASAQAYVDTVGRYAQWYAGQSQLRTGAPPSLAPPSATAASTAPSGRATTTAPAATTTAPRPAATAGSSAAARPSVTVPATTAAPDRTGCTDSAKVGDVTVRACWTWGWVKGTSIWRPRTMRLTTSDATKAVTVTIMTSEENSPVSLNLGKVSGNLVWLVPATFSWDMTAGVESTTTYVVRRVPGRQTDCTARIRHQPTKAFVMDVTGSC
ncbi:hypothetical protein [Dactylosporangium sp. CA-233914]|uniref:hypothetical protein n=1 Tax=Dactylosporangium sp. CA-233914 TaxID=3239934 RepID=UPI003D900E5D